MNMESALKLNKNLYFSENKNKYHKLNDITDNSKIYKDIINNSSFAEIPENLISRYEYKYQLEKRFKIIRAIEKKENMNLKNNNQKNNYNNNEEEFDHYYWHFLFSKKTIINNLEESHIKDIISTDPDNIIIKSKICFPITKLFTIYNPDTEDNLLIKDIKSDLYQVKIYPNIQEDYNIERLESEFESLTKDESYRARMLSRYTQMQNQLGAGGASKRTALAIKNLLQ